MSSAADRVPECEDLKVLAAYMEGRFLLWQDKPEMALQRMKLCINRLPPEYGVDDNIINAKMGAAFNAGDYDEFLACAKSFDKKYPKDRISKATLASAYACKYAETGDEKFRKQSEAFLDQARKMTADDPYFKEYENRIMHRLYSKEIISRQEFMKRYPDGWDRQLAQ